MKSLKVIAACAMFAVAPVWAQTAKFPDRLIRIERLDFMFHRSHQRSEVAQLGANVEVVFGLSVLRCQHILLHEMQRFHIQFAGSFIARSRNDANDGHRRRMFV